MSNNNRNNNSNNNNPNLGLGSFRVPRKRASQSDETEQQASSSLSTQPEPQKPRFYTPFDPVYGYGGPPPPDTSSDVAGVAPSYQPFKSFTPREDGSVARSSGRRRNWNRPYEKDDMDDSTFTFVSNNNNWNNNSSRNNDNNNYNRSNDRNNNHTKESNYNSYNTSQDSGQQDQVMASTHNNNVNDAANHHVQNDSTKAYRDQLMEQLEAKDLVLLPLEELPPPGWEDRKKMAAAAVKEELKHQEELQKLPKKMEMEEYIDPEDGVNSDTDVQEPTMKKMAGVCYEEFIDALPGCIPLTLGFHIPDIMKQDWCFCPCHRVMKKWRESVGLTGIEFNCASKTTGRFEAPGLIDHLEQKSQQEKQQLGKGVAKGIYHDLVLRYLKVLYHDYYASEHTIEPLLHKAFYKKSSKDHRLAETYENQRKARALQDIENVLANERAVREDLERKNSKLSQELENLKKVSPNQAEKKEQEMKIRQKFNLLKSVEDKISEPILQSVIKAYKECWDTSHSAIGMTTSSVKNLLFSVPQSIDIQEIFDKWYKTPQTSCIFSVEGRAMAQKLLMWSTVDLELAGKRELGLKSKLKQDSTAIDAGGVSREFFSQIWRQMGSLRVNYSETRGRNGKNTEVAVLLFAEGSEAGCVPVADDIVSNALRELTEDGQKKATKKIEAYFRAIGRLMIHWLATDPAVIFRKFKNAGGEQFGHTIAETAIPALYRNALLRGLEPHDACYPLGELVDHVLELVDFSQSRHNDSDKKEQALKQKLDLSANEEDIRKLAQESFVDTRKIALTAFKDGLTLDGLVNLSHFFKFTPLAAFKKILFSKAVISVKDVMAALDNGGQPVVPNDMWQYFEYQANLISELKSILTERDSDEYKRRNPDRDDFLGQFVNFCTGSWTIPDNCHGSFKIQIEFQKSLPDDGLPVAHTCVNVIGFPAKAYNGCRKTLEERLDRSIELCRGGFSMN